MPACVLDPLVDTEGGASGGREGGLCAFVAAASAAGSEARLTDGNALTH